MAWIESHQSLSRHRKTLALVASLKADRHKILGHLHELWWWGLDNADVDGRLGHTSHVVIAEAAGWPVKQADTFVGALVAAGFMEDNDNGLVLHDWEDYAGKLIDRRDRNRERMRRARASDDAPIPPPTNGTRAAHVQRTNVARAQQRADTFGATVPNPTQPNPTGQDTNPPAASQRPPKGQRRVTVVDDAFKADLEEQFAGEFGSREAVRDVIDTAMSHTARLKCTDQQAYLRGWVRRDAQRLPGKPRTNSRGGLSVLDANGPRWEQRAGADGKREWVEVTA